MFVGKLARFGIVDHQNVDVFETLGQLGGSAFDPIIHGVESDVLWRTLDLLQYAALQIGSDVGQENVFGISEFLRQFRIEIGENVEVGDQGFALVQVLGIFSSPEK